MLLTKTVKIQWNRSNNNYIRKGYVYTKIGDIFEVNVEDLNKSSKELVEIKCDNIGCNISKSITWKSYLLLVKEDGKYYCRKCALELFTRDKMNKTILEKANHFNNGVSKIIIKIF